MKKLMSLILSQGNCKNETAQECCAAPCLPEHDVPCDWRDEARLAAQLHGWNLQESDLLTVRSYMEYRIKEKHAFFIGLSCHNVTLPGGAVLLVWEEENSPLLLIWEEDITEE